MVFTSYFANIKNISGEKVSISQYLPKGLEMEQYLKLSPSVELLKSFKDRDISNKAFNSSFTQHLKSLDAQKIISHIEDKTLFCYEKPTEFCHRILVRKWLAKNCKLALEYKRNYKVAIVGSRRYKNQKEFNFVINKLLQGFREEQKISFVSGGAKGADGFAKEYALKNNIEITELLPEWEVYGKSAGFRRNSSIWENSDFGIAFWDGVSKGTRQSLDLAKTLHKILVIYDFTQKKFHIFNNERSEFSNLFC